MLPSGIHVAGKQGDGAPETRAICREFAGILVQYCIYENRIARKMMLCKRPSEADRNAEIVRRSQVGESNVSSGHACATEARNGACAAG